MAKQSKATSTKLVFGKRKVGKAKKRNGPKDKPVKPYRKQGR
jgi:hypothetical protein